MRDKRLISLRTDSRNNQDAQNLNHRDLTPIRDAPTLSNPPLCSGPTSPLPPHLRSRYTTHLRSSARLSWDGETLKRPIDPGSSRSSSTPSLPLTGSRPNSSCQSREHELGRSSCEGRAGRASTPALRTALQPAELVHLKPIRSHSSPDLRSTAAPREHALLCPEERPSPRLGRKQLEPDPFPSGRPPIVTSEKTMAANEKNNEATSPGCLGVCEVSTAKRVGDRFGAWLIGTVAPIMLGLVTGCVASLAGCH
jgi:hypothetical protein